MKKTALFIFICLILFAACDTGFESLRKAPEAGYGRVAVTISGATARNVFPALPSAKYEYLFARVIGGTAGEWEAQEPEDGYFMLELGEWQVNVLVYANVSDTTPAASGTSDTFTVSGGETAQVTVQLAGNIEAGSEGTFSYYIKYPADAEITVFSLENLLDDEADTIDLTPVSGTADGGDSSILVLSGTYTESVPAGYYYLTILLEKDGAATGANEVVYIYDKLDSAYGTAENPVVFTEVNFSHVHVWGELTQTTAPTCEEAGEGTRRCTVCDYEDPEMQSIDALGHEWRESSITPATCSATGTENDICSRNASHTRTLIIPINPNAHQLNVDYLLTQPTCTTAGQGAIVCLLNAEHSNPTQTVVIPVLGHLYNWVETTAPNCTTAGVDTGTCTRDPSHTDTRTGADIIPDAHDWNTVMTTTATETTDGEEGYVCNHNNSHTKDTRTAYATGTAGLNFTAINNNTAYSVGKGSVTSGAVYIPAYRLNDYTGEYLPVTEIQNDAFYSIGLTSVTFAENSQLTTISSYAFWSCTGLTGITIPASVTSIGFAAFSGCGLTSVTFAEGSQLETIGISAFSGTSLTMIAIPANVTIIGETAFSNCTSLASITIPENVMSIGEYAFRNCTSLTSITIPASVTSIYRWAFVSWTSSQIIYVHGKNSRQATITAGWNNNWDTGCNATIVYANDKIVTFNSNGGSVVNRVIVEQGNTISSPDTTRNGYTLGGWYKDSELTDLWNFTTDTVTENITLYAKWIVHYTVTFNSNGGSAVASQIIDHGSTATRPANPTKAGSDFVDWYTNTTLTTVYNFTTQVTGAITLYAKWGKFATSQQDIDDFGSGAFIADITVNNAADLSTAIAIINSGGDSKNYIINVNATISTSPIPSFTPTDICVSIRGNGITLNSAGTILTIATNQKVIIRDCTLRGWSSVSNSNNSLIRNDGTLELKGTTNVTGHRLDYNRNGGGVYNTGTFIMWDNSSVSGNSIYGGINSAYGSGVYNTGTFIMRDNSSVYGNNISVTTPPQSAAGGGVCNYGTFIMRGNASVTNNSATGPANSEPHGGGVMTWGASGIFRMEGGTISGNTASGSTAASGSSLYASGTAEYGTFDGDEWTSKGTLSTTNNAITVVNGVLQQ